MLTKIRKNIHKDKIEPSLLNELLMLYTYPNWDISNYPL